MCGITGALDTNSDPLVVMQRVKQMTTLVGHRGPDFSSVKTLDTTVFGHSRLSIIDVSSASHQPFIGVRKNSALTYNGEIYNFKILRKRLQDEGDVFNTDGDTEVLHHLMLRFGLDALPKLHGMFAFGFWNAAQKRLLLVRDRMGIKPLYYTFFKGGLYFSSEIRALAPVIDFRLNRRQLNRFLALQSVPGEETLVEGIKEVPPGHALIYDADGSFSVQAWYDPIAVWNQEKDEAITPNLIRKQFFTAVKRRLISDVPIGAFLSGGIDSSAVVAAMAQQSSKPVKTFSIGFKDADFDERSYATEVAKKFETDHTEIVLSSDEILENVPKAVSALDTPSGDAINTYIVSAYTRKSGLTVALSGLGGDEFFSGYPSFALWRKLAPFRWMSKTPAISRRVLSRLIPDKDAGSDKLKSLIAGSFTPGEIVYRSRQVLTDAMMTKLGVIPMEWLGAFGADVKHDQDAISYAEFMLYCIPVLLKDTDQMSMASALEVRVPFLDHEFFSTIARIPTEKRSPKYGNWPKWFFVKAMENDIPESCYKRPKAGFVLPMESWMKNELEEYTRNGLNMDVMQDVFGKASLEQFSNLFFRQDSHISWSRIWLLSVLGNWMKTNSIRL